MRSTGEMLYLLMVIGAFTAFALVLAWVERSWQPKGRATSGNALPHAAE